MIDNIAAAERVRRERGFAASTRGAFFINRWLWRAEIRCHSELSPCIEYLLLAAKETIRLEVFWMQSKIKRDAVDVLNDPG